MQRWVVIVAGIVLSCGMGKALSQSKKAIRVGPDLTMPFSSAVRAGNFIYVSGTLATDDSGKIIAGDVKAQTKRILEIVSQALRKAGSGIENAVSVNVYLRSISDFPAMNEIYQSYWPKDPPARTTIAAGLVRPEGLVEISMIAVPKGGERRVIHPAGWLKSPLPYSYGILSGDTLFMAGLVARNIKDNRPVSGGMKEQVKVVMENAGEILKAAGMDYGDIAASRVFITDAAMFRDMNEAYRAWFPMTIHYISHDGPPARATAVAGLVSPEYKVEIAMVAVKDTLRAAISFPFSYQGPVNHSLSSAVQYGNRLFLSGFGNTEGNKGNIRSQTRQTLASIHRVLKSQGFEWKDVVDAVVYLTDMGNYAGMNEAYREVFGIDFPARATVRTGLVAPESLVEIMFTAVK